jgi:LacI family transcriptional regulator
MESEGMKSTEIAKLAGVSRSTVSRVLNNYKNVPEETRIKVQKVIDEYGYTPNPSARALAGQANDIIELVIADIDESLVGSSYRGAKSPYFLETIYSIINQAKLKNHMVLVNIITDSKEYKKISYNFDTRMIRGGIFVGFPYHTSEINALVEKGYNIVAVDNFTEKEAYSYKAKAVNSDNFTGGKIATQYLIDHGHTKIGFIEGDSRLSAIERKEGFLSAMNDSGLSIIPNSMVKGFFREEVAYEETLNMLEKTEITAIFCSNDIMALGAIKAINEKGLSIPEDISLVGFDNHDLSSVIKEDLTSVYIDLNDVSKLCVDGIFEDGSFLKYCDPKLYEGNTVKTI